LNHYRESTLKSHSFAIQITLGELWLCFWFTKKIRLLRIIRSSSKP